MRLKVLLKKHLLQLSQRALFHHLKLSWQLTLDNGGEDPGSIGPTRKYEKHVTLAIAKKVSG